MAISHAAGLLKIALRIHYDAGMAIPPAGLLTSSTAHHFLCVILAIRKCAATAKTTWPRGTGAHLDILQQRSHHNVGEEHERLELLGCLQPVALVA